MHTELRSISLLLPFVAALTPWVSYAQTLSERAAVQLALRQNSALQAARFSVDEARARAGQARRLPNPELELSYASDRAYNDEGEFGVAAGFRQSFPVAGRLAAAGRVGETDIALAEAEIADYERKLTAAVLSLARRMQIFELRDSAIKELMRSFDEVIAVSERRFKLAEVSEADLNLERLERESLNRSSAALSLERLEAEEQLNLLIGSAEPAARARKIAVDLRPRTSAELDSAESGAFERRADRLAAQLNTQRAIHGENLVRAERWHDWTAGVEYSRDREVFDDPIGRKTDQFIGFSLSVPLPLWDQRTDALAEMRAQRNRRVFELQAIDQQIRAAIKAARSKLDGLGPIVHRYEHQTVPLARRNLETLRTSYAQGLVGMTSVLQGQQQLIQIQQQYLDTLEEFAAALTEFESETASFKLEGQVKDD